MSARLCILCCHNFHAEVGAGVTAEGWNDVVAVAFPARCGRPPVSWDELRPLLPADCGQVVVLGRSCLSKLGEPPADWPPTRSMPVQQCFHIVAGETQVNEAIAGGGYLITAAWLADWRGQLQSMGFAPEQAGEFFHDFARELVLLDSGLDLWPAAAWTNCNKPCNCPSGVFPSGWIACDQNLPDWCWNGG